MKRYLLNSVLLALVIIILTGIIDTDTILYAQSDTSRVKTVRLKDSCQAGSRCGGNCPKMRRDGKVRHGKQMKTNKGKDTFIDKNGDGINDNRCSGMGLTNCPNAKKVKKIDSVNNTKRKPK